MNYQQRIAYASPCFHPEETESPQFYQFVTVGQLRVSVGLTANIGLE